MKSFTIDDIRSWKPCYDPIRHLPEGWRGTATDILRNDSISHADRLWVVLRTDITSERVMRLFAVWSARQVVKPDADPRTLHALNVAEAYAIGNASAEVLAAAESAARSAAWAAESAARSAAESAARSAAWSAAESAAWAAAWAAESAAESAARSAAWAAESAARSAAESAARSAAWSAAESAARSAAWSARSAQREKLIEMIEAEERGALCVS